MIRNLVLDLDGPVLEGKQRHYECYRKILAEQGLTALPIQQYWELKRNRVQVRDVLSLTGAPDIADAFARKWLERIEAREYLVFDQLQTGVIEILQAWKSSGIRLILATLRNSRENLHWQLEHFGILLFFDAVVCVESARGAAGKAAEVRSSLPGNFRVESIWIGDTEVDIKAGKELGIPVCAVECGLRTGEYLRSLKPDWLASDLYSFATRFSLPDAPVCDSCAT